MTVITTQNGRLDVARLTRTRTGQPLLTVAAHAYARLDQAMRAAGQGALTLSTGLSGYRTLADQQRMRDLGLTTIAVGRSPHGEGLAADFQGLGGLTGARYRWLRERAGPFGWVHPIWAQAGGVNPSPHHWEYDHRRDIHAGHTGPPPDTAVVPEDEDMQLIRIIEDGRIMAVGAYQFAQVPTMDDYNALAQVWGVFTDMSVHDAQRLHQQVARNIVDLAGSLRGQGL